jgi:hypothetical protein
MNGDFNTQVRSPGSLPSQQKSSSYLARIRRVCKFQQTSHRLETSHGSFSQVGVLADPYCVTPVIQVGRVPDCAIEASGVSVAPATLRDRLSSNRAIGSAGRHNLSNTACIFAHQAPAFVKPHRVNCFISCKMQALSPSLLSFQRPLYLSTRASGVTP